MYWPCGVPQVYVHRGRSPEITHGDEADENDPETPDHSQADPENAIIDVCNTRSDHVFATVTTSSLSIWSTRPTVVLATYSRSAKSIQTYGANLEVLFRPDATIVVVRTNASYLLTFAVESDQSNRVFQQNSGHSLSRRQSVLRNFGTDETVGLAEILLRFRRSIKIDAGIAAVISIDQELVVATIKPAAVQCIKLETEKDKPQAVAQLLSKSPWIGKNTVNSMTYDRAMNLFVWIGADGSAYVVQRSKPDPALKGPLNGTEELQQPPTLFTGYCFHSSDDGTAIKASINARFSMIALALSDSRVVCYAAKDYAGNVPVSHSFKSSTAISATGKINSLSWSPDGYCLFVAYEHGWATWSAFGKEGASSFECNQSHAETSDEIWLLGAHTAHWIGNGSEILLTTGDDRLFKIEMSRSAATGCFSCANLVRALLQSPSEVSVYRGHDLPDLTSISNESSLWQHAQFPASYLYNQGPIRASVVSQDGRYIAVAGRRGLSHYSVNSGRWKTFSDPGVENSFAVRGGMCWFSHILAAATESVAGYDLRLYSRELDLSRNPLSVESFAMPIVFVGPSGEDSLLVYTYENVLYHYVISTREHRAQLVQVGQIAFHGVVRAPSRVRSVSWVVPDSQLRSGDPSRDVEYASVLFLVDDKLVLLQPSHTPEDELKYDLRVIAQHVEFYILMRDQIYFNFNGGEESMPSTPSPGALLNRRRNSQSSLRDSLWIFCGDDLRLWPDVRDVLHFATEGDLPADAPLLSVPIDFYPLSILLNKGVVLGIEGQLLQRRNVGFAQWRSGIRTQLFLPYIFRRQLLTTYDTPTAFALANQYQHLSYFPHALEILLHHVLDDEHEAKSTARKPLPSPKRPLEPGRPVTPTIPHADPLPSVLSFLQILLPPTTYLSTIVSCVRKTELSYWPTLFDHLPAPLSLFEQALELEDLKTASGFLIILQGLEDNEEDQHQRKPTAGTILAKEEQEETSRSTLRRRQTNLEAQVVHLMKLAREKEDFELCSELARFMMGVDPRGDALRRVTVEVGFREKTDRLEVRRGRSGSASPSPGSTTGSNLGVVTSRKEKGKEARGLGLGAGDDGDYFSASPGGY
jgi:RAB6A-GEF complex partner protein 1